MDETLENSQLRQYRVSSYFNNNIDLKLKQMNMQDEISEWSESNKKIPSPNKKKNPEDFSDLLQQTNQLMEISSCKDIYRKEELQAQQYLSNRYIPNDYLFNHNSNCMYQQEDTNILFSPKSPKSYYDQMLALKSTDVKDNDYRQNKGNKPTDLNTNKHKESSINNSHHNLTGLQKINISTLAKMRQYMMRFYKQFTIFGLTQQLNKQVRSFIDDKSDVITIEQTQINYLSYKFYKFYKKYLHFFYNMRLLNVQDNFGFAIQIVFTLLNCLFLYFFTLIFIFKGFEECEYIQSIIKIIWIVEIVIQLNTAPYYISSIKCDRKSIFYNYFKQKSLFDVIPILLLNVKVDSEGLQILIHILVFLKIKNVTSDLSYLQKRICMKVKRYYIVQIFNLVFQLFLIGHIIGCLWFIIAKIEYNILGSEYSWFDDLRENNQIWWHYYIWSLYWSLTLMTTGSNTANTLLQASFTTIILLFTTISFGYFLNEISIILSTMDESLQQKRKDVNIINEYMRQKRISKKLQAKVNIDLEYYYINNFKKTCDDYNQVFDKISVDLKNALLKEYNQQILNKIPCLTNNFSRSLIEELSLCLQEEYYLPNQFIFKESDQNIVQLIYVISGQVELIKFEDTESGQKCRQFACLSQNQIYGEVNLFTGQASQYSIRSVQFSKVLRIDRNRFIQLIRARQKEFEIFCQIKDKILFFQDHSNINRFCLSCNSQYHLVQDCQYLHFNKPKAFLKAKLLQARQSDRQKIERKSRKSIKTIIDLKKLQEYAKQARIFLQTKQPTSNKFYTIELSCSSNQDEDEEESGINIESNGNNGFDATSLKVYESESPKKSQSKQESEYFMSKQYISALTQDMNTKTHHKLCTSHLSLESINDKEIELLAQKGQIQQESLRKLFSDSVKIQNKESFDLLKPINFSENLQIYKDPSDIEFNQIYQKLLQKMKIQRKSILKQTQPKSLKFADVSESKMETLRSLQKLFKQITSDFREDGNSEEIFRIKSSSIMNNNITNEDLCAQDNQLTWEFDHLRDYAYYFENGNSKYSIYRINRFLKRKNQIQHKKIKRMKWI